MTEEKKKRNVSEATKDKLRKNLAKARSVRSAKAVNRREVKDASRNKLVEMSNTLKDVLMVISTSFADGKVNKDCCSACESNYIPGRNSCPCQKAWATVGEVEEYLKDAS